MIDPLTRLATLPPAEPAPERAARIRQRCRTELARRAPRAARKPARPARDTRSPLWPAAMATLCVAYVAEALVLALDLLQPR